MASAAPDAAFALAPPRQPVASATLLQSLVPLQHVYSARLRGSANTAASSRLVRFGFGCKLHWCATAAGTIAGVALLRPKRRAQALSRWSPRRAITPITIERDPGLEEEDDDDEDDDDFDDSTSKAIVHAEFDDHGEVEGPLCSIWLDSPEHRGKISNEVMNQEWIKLADKVKSLNSNFVRACRKGAKQVATLGPASTSEDMIERLFLCGVDVFRLNFSHGEHSEKTQLIQKIRNVEARYMHPIGILADMQGPKQRCGKFEKDEGVKLTEGSRFRFDLDPTPGTVERVQLPHPEILVALEPGRTLLLDDGKIKMKVVEIGCKWQGEEMAIKEQKERPSTSTEECPPFVVCEVQAGGQLSAKKGVNTPDVVLPISPITDKDKVDINFACKSDVDWIAMSFVQKHQDMLELRTLIERSQGARPKILAKIEKPSAVSDLEAILKVSDGVMVARGDLGVEMNPEQVPFVQKDMIAKANAAGKPVIVATQMLESMIKCPSPTRAECSDIANAIIDGCDAVMLSGETAVGDYPAECVEMQRRVIETAESFTHGAPVSHGPAHHKPLALDYSNAIAAAAATLAKGVKANAIVCFTSGGTSISRIVQLRPSMPILAVCPCLETARRLSLLRGVYATSEPQIQALGGRVQMDGPYSVRFAEAMEIACRIARDKGLVLDKDDELVFISRLPLFSEGDLNTIRLVSGMGPSAADGYGPGEKPSLNPPQQ